MWFYSSWMLYFLVLFFSLHFGLDHFFFISKFTTIFLSSALSSVLISTIEEILCWYAFYF